MYVFLHVLEHLSLQFEKVEFAGFQDNKKNVVMMKYGLCRKAYKHFSLTLVKVHIFKLCEQLIQQQRFQSQYVKSHLTDVRKLIENTREIASFKPLLHRFLRDGSVGSSRHQ